MRYNGHAGLTIGGNEIISAVPTAFDSTFTCVGALFDSAALLPYSVNDHHLSDFKGL